MLPLDGALDLKSDVRAMCSCASGLHCFVGHAGRACSANAASQGASYHWYCAQAGGEGQVVDQKKEC